MDASERARRAQRVEELVKNYPAASTFFLRSGIKVIVQDEYRRRMIQCALCENWNPDEKRCKLCNCNQPKFYQADEQCPVPQPRWGKVDVNGPLVQKAPATVQPFAKPTAIPKLTIGMATFQDCNGVTSTIQDFRMGNDCSQVEFVVVDQAPNTAHGEGTKKFIEDINNAGNPGCMGIRYIPYTEVIGTVPAKNRVFQEAKGEVVCCVDSHIQTYPNVIARIIQHFQTNPGTMDLWQGPIIYNSLSFQSTHLEEYWRGEMWGIWGTNEKLTLPDGPPAEIWGMGMGLFACRREAWLGFTQGMRGFGGEEGAIHAKYRKHGRKVWCLPWLKWWHRFNNPEGRKSPLRQWDKVRNYVLAYRELGMPLDILHRHFCEGRMFGQGKDEPDPYYFGTPEKQFKDKHPLFPEQRWQYLIADPVNRIEPPN